MSQRRLLSCLVVALAAGSATLQLAAAQSTPVASQRVPGPNHHDDPARHPHLGVWVTPDGHIRHELLPDGDTVAVRWDGAAPMKDGQIYRNSYAWFFTLRDGKVVEATAFLDLPTYDAALAGTALPPGAEAAPDKVGPDA